MCRGVLRIKKIYKNPRKVRTPHKQNREEILPYDNCKEMPGTILVNKLLLLLNLVN